MIEEIEERELAERLYLVWAEAYEEDLELSRLINSWDELSRAERAAWRAVADHLIPKGSLAIFFKQSPDGVKDHLDISLDFGDGADPNAVCTNAQSAGFRVFESIYDILGGNIR